jgi:hypothetical protein
MLEPFWGIMLMGALGSKNILTHFFQFWSVPKERISRRKEQRLIQGKEKKESDNWRPRNDWTLGPKSWEKALVTHLQKTQNQKKSHFFGYKIQYFKIFSTILLFLFFFLNGFFFAWKNHFLSQKHIQNFQNFLKP